MLYQPTESELTSYLDRAKAKSNNIAKVTERSLTLVTEQNFYYTQDHGWKCYSSQTNDPKQAYLVNGKCSCPAYTKHGAGTFKVGYQTYCKHRIGLNIYLDILQNHLNLRVLGPFTALYSGDVAVRSKAHPWTYLGILTDSNTACTHAYGNNRVPEPVCDVHGGESTGGDYRFASKQDASKFAHWLARANPLPHNDQKAGKALYEEMRSSGFSHALADLATYAVNCANEAELRSLWDTSGWQAFQSTFLPTPT